MIIWSLFLLCWIFFVWRLLTPRIGIHVRGPLIWIEILFLLLLYAFIIVTAYGLGLLLLRFSNLPLSKAERNILSLLLGLAVFSIGIMIIGLIGWLNTAGLLAWLGISGFIAFRQLLEVAQESEIRFSQLTLSHPPSPFEILLLTTVIISIPFLLIGLALPVSDYDALFYHLDIPRQFLAEGRIYFDPETWRSAYPFLGEMPFILGINFGVDSLAKFINLTYAFLFVSSVYLFSVRFLGHQIALTTTAILMGAPAFFLWATWAAVDYAWGTFEFWSVYAIYLWLTPENRMSLKWLVLAGIMLGCAASIKYLSLPTLLMVGAIVVWKSIENGKIVRTRWLHNLFIFGSSAALVMGAWYIKNWLWTGNPVYPLVFGGPGWEPLENQVLNDYVQTFGMGKSWIDYLLLPFNVYAHQTRFSTIPSEIIHPALCIGVFFPFVAKSKSNRILNIILIYAACYFVLWAVTSQVIRFLLPLSAFGGILAATVIEGSPSFLRNLLKFGLLGGLLIFSLLQLVSAIRDSGGRRYFMGQKSTAQILESTVNDFRMKAYIQDTLPSSDRVLFLWDGRGYYCDQRCIPDDEQSAAIRLSIDSPEPQQLARDLSDLDITHLMLSTTDARWFISYHDPRRLHKTAFQYFTRTFLPACGRSIFKDQKFELFAITCH